MKGTDTLLRSLVVVAVLILLIPLLLMLGMMISGGSAGMMSHMSGMMGMTMGSWIFAILWMTLLAAALVLLVILVSRGKT